MEKHTFFLNIHGTLTKNKYVLGPESGLNNYKDLAIEATFIDDSAIKLEIKKKQKDIFKSPWEFPGDPVVKIHLVMQGMWVSSLVGKLRSHMPWSN